MKTKQVVQYNVLDTIMKNKTWRGIIQPLQHTRLYLKFIKYKHIDRYFYCFIWMNNYLVTMIW